MRWAAHQNDLLAFRNTHAALMAGVIVVATSGYSSRQVSSRPETSNPFIEFVGAWSDLLPARSTLEYTQGNFRVLCYLPRSHREI